MITVSALVAARAPELTVLAGQAGGERLVTWAHVCDLPDPWTWVRPGDLVLTTGDGLPPDAPAQAAWMSTLCDVGVAGLVLAPRPGAPDATADMLEVADERSVPLLGADFALQFSELSRMVIESAVQSERDHIHTARRLFDVYTEALRGRADLAGRLDAVGRSVDWSIVVARRDDESVLAGGGPVQGDAEAPITVPVPGHPTMEVRVRATRRRRLDGSLVHYLAGLVGIELEHLARDVERRDRRGEIVVRGALDGTINAAQLGAELAERGMRDGAVVVAVLRASSAPPAGMSSTGVVSPAVSVGPTPPVARVGGDLVALLPVDWSGASAFGHGVDPAGVVGLSRAAVLGADLREAHLEARAALAAALECHRPMVSYDELDQIGSAGPRTLTEMRALVERVLGPLLEHDRASSAELVHTLIMFTDSERSWTRTAEALGVHRQTLVYRIGQIERLTGIKPTASDGIATFWTALAAAATTGAIPPRPARG